MPYAKGTTVQVDKTRAEIEKMLMKFGASGFGYASQGGQVMIAFIVRDRHIRFMLPMPQATDKMFTRTETGKARAPLAAAVAYEAEQRRRWRALFIILKAKLTAIEDDVTTFEDEFSTHIVLPDGTTAGEHLTKAIETAYETGIVPPLLGIGAK